VTVPGARDVVLDRRVTSPLRYRLSVPRPESHLVEVELRVAPPAAGATLRLEMAAWCPGSYLIRDYARHVRDLEARDAESGQALPLRQVSKREWEVESGGGEVAVSYRVYGHDLTVRTNHVDASHAFLHGPALYLFPGDARDAACEVAIEPPPGREWPVVTALEPAGADRFRADDVDQLLDCPIHIGPVELRELEAGGRPVTLAVWGGFESATSFGLDGLTRDLAAVVDAHAARLGPLPCDRYTFLLMLSPGAYGGLEHASSSANLNHPHAFATARGYYELIELLSHELFHVWNGKRLRPRAFDRFDYGRENYTRCLWMVEGVTSYYDRLTARRAGVVPLNHYLSKLAEEWGRLQLIPGRRRHSLEDASFNAWIKLYRPNESNLNTTVSYYLKGGLVMCALDLELRRRSNGEMNLDRVLVHMWREYGAAGRGYPEDLQPIFEQAAGLELGDFFARCIRGCEDPDLPGELATVGLNLRPGWERQSPEECAPPPAWLGVTMQGSGRTVAGVLDGGPGERGGLSPGDEIVALNRYQVSGEADLRQRLAGRAAGEPVELALFRRGRLEVCEVVPQPSPPTRVEVVAAAASEGERQRFADWLGAPHPGEGVVATASVAGSL
jgi:predicted metalloprotease with PDZ domain